MSKTFWIIALIAFINALSFTIIIPSLYPFGKHFALSDFQIGLLASIYAIAQFFATPIFGKLSDRIGRKPLLQVSLVGTVLANLVAAFSPVAGWLYFARFIDGITGGNTSVAQAIIVDITKPEERAKGFGIFGAAFGLGFIFGPVLSYLAQKFTIFGIPEEGMPFLVSFVVALLAVLITTFFLPETLKTKETKPLTLATLGFDKLFQSLFIPKLGRIFVMNFFVGLTFTFFTFAIQPYILNTLHQSNQTLSLVYAAFGVIGLISQVFLIKPMTTKFDLINTLSISLLVRGLTFILIPLFPSFVIFFVISLFMALLNSFPQVIFSTLISFNSKPEEQGVMAGVNSSFLSLSNSLGPIIAGALTGFSASIPFFGAGVGTLILAWLALDSRKYLKFKAE